MLLVSLIGEQPIPNLLAVRHLQPDEVLLVYTTRTEAVAQRLRRLISGHNRLNADLKTDPYHFEPLYQALQERLAGRSEVYFNLTGGTKMMGYAAYSLAAREGHPFIYLQSEGRRSRLYLYRFQEGRPVLEPPQEIPTVLNCADYLNAHLPGFRETGFHHDEKGRLSAGGAFEQAAYNALKSHSDEVLSGVRPEGVADQIEIDLMVRLGNQVGLAEVKTGDDSGKRGLDQLKMAGEPTYLGTYAAQFLIVAQRRLRPSIETLARERHVHIIYLPNYQDGQPLLRSEAEHLSAEVRRVLLPPTRGAS